MSLYRITYENGLIQLIRARDPKHAFDIASRFSPVRWIKCIRNIL